MYLLRNLRYHHNHPSYNITDTVDDKARQWHIKLVGDYYVCVGLRHCP